MLTSATPTLAMSRRNLIAGIGAGMIAASLPARVAAHGSMPNPLMRQIPSTGERVPAIGLGTFMTFDTIPGQHRAHLGEVLRAYWDGGARLVDTSPLYGTGEITVGDYANAFGIADQLFIANKLWATGDFLADESHLLRSLTTSQQRLWRERIDLMQCHSLVNVDVVLPYLRAWKREGRIRYLGVTHHENTYHPALMSWIERGGIDFVQVNYSIFNRAAEERLLPLAQQRGIGVLVNMPFEKARLFAAVEGREVPAFARDAGITTWAAYFLKWVLANPAVTAVLPSTSDPAHARENIAALRGPLPEPDLRRRMLDHMATISAFARIASQPWYPGKTYPGIINRAQAELRERG